jgi:hypothetical protein
MGSCHVPDRRRRYGVEKDSFATLMGHWRTAHRMASVNPASTKSDAAPALDIAVGLPSQQRDGKRPDASALGDSCQELSGVPNISSHHFGAHSCHVRPVSSPCYKP